MAALDFPASPSLNDIYTANNQSWQWDGTSWVSLPPTNLTLGALTVSGASTFTNSAPSAIGGLGFRNRVINGDMRIDQRNEGAAVTNNSSSNGYGLDRFIGNGMPSAGVFTMARSTTAPAGFTNSLLITVTTADASIAATDRYFFATNVEGLNCSDFGFGTATAKTVTLSFWVRSSVTGTFSGSLSNNAFNRAYPFTYTINAADTFEYKTITIPGDTSGTWLTDNGIGIRIYIDLGAGANFRTTAGSWANAGYIGATSAVNLISTVSATWYITGVQLEVGNAATEFERRPFGQELILCQRYYATSIETGKIVTDFATLNTSGVGGIVGYSTGAGGDMFQNLSFPVAMRANPTLTVYSGANRTAGSVRDMVTGTDVANFANGAATSSNKGIGYLAGNALTLGRMYGFHYVASAEY
jgi:hypothetical protein